MQSISFQRTLGNFLLLNKGEQIKNSKLVDFTDRFKSCLVKEKSITMP